MVRTTYAEFRLVRKGMSIVWSSLPLLNPIAIQLLILLGKTTSRTMRHLMCPRSSSIWAGSSQSNRLRTSSRVSFHKSLFTMYFITTTSRRGAWLHLLGEHASALSLHSSPCIIISSLNHVAWWLGCAEPGARTPSGFLCSNHHYLRLASLISFQFFDLTRS